MDLEEFEVNLRGVDTAIIDTTSPLSVPDAFRWMDAEWHTASRRARWMDLLGDYAGVEPFIIDGGQGRQCSMFVSPTPRMLFLQGIH